MSKIIGIDPGTELAIVCIENGKPKMELNEFKTQNYERMFAIEEKIKEALKIQPDLVLVEGYAFAKGFRAHTMGEIGWAIRRQLIKSGVKWLIVPPSKVKKFVSGKGNIKKNLVLLNVYKRWNVEISNDNIADAFVLAKIGEYLLNEPEEIPKFQKQILKELRKELEK